MSTMTEHGCQGRRREKMVGLGMATTMMNVVIVGEKEVVWERVECGKSAGMLTRKRQRSPRPKKTRPNFQSFRFVGFCGNPSVC